MAWVSGGCSGNVPKVSSSMGHLGFNDPPKYSGNKPHISVWLAASTTVLYNPNATIINLYGPHTPSRSYAIHSLLHIDAEPCRVRILLLRAGTIT